MKVTQCKIEKVTPYENNPRRNEEAVAGVARSIEELGFRQPIVVDEDGVIIAGHTRLLAAKRLGMEKVPVHVAEDLTAEEARALRIADNRTAEAAEWDTEKLAEELGDLRTLLDDFEVTGFDLGDLGDLEAELAAREKAEPKTNPDEVLGQAEEAVAEDARPALRMLAGYRTALHRTEMSPPMKWFRAEGMLEGDVLDYGAGMDPHDHARFDPAYDPDYLLLKQRWDVVTVNSVFDVVPLEHNRVEMLLALLGLLKPDGVLLVSVSKEGGIDSAGEGFRSGWTKAAWTDFFRTWAPTTPLRGTGGSFWAWRLRQDSE